MSDIGPSTELTVLHTSDNHMDQMSTCNALAAVVDKANSLNVDLAIFAGDFFDNSRVANDVIKETIRQLGRFNMPVVLVPGNHDQLDSISVYHNQAFKDLPPNLHLFREREGESILFPELEVQVWGRPTYDHHIGFRPLESTPPRNGPWWHIGIVHGMYIPPGEENFDRSSPIYAKEIEDTGYDYIALGHSDIFEELTQGTVKAAYSGAPIESTDGKVLGSVAIVHFHPKDGIDIKKVPLP